MAKARKTNSAPANLMASMAATGASAAASLLAVPFYIKYMGMAAVGLIGFGIMLNAIIRILDLGFTTAIIKETAFLSGKSNQSRLFTASRTFAVFFAAIAIPAGLCLIFLAPWIGRYWLNPQDIDLNVAINCIRLAGVQCIISWASSYFTSTLVALEKQVPVSICRTIEGLLTTSLLITIAIYNSGKIEYIFLAQTFMAALWMVVYSLLFKQAIPHMLNARYINLLYLKRARKFIIGLSGAALISTILINVDRVLVSSLLSLAEFGHYSLASSSVGTGFTILVGSLYSVILPRFVNLVRAGNEQELSQTYHTVVQLVAALTIPVLPVFFFFAQDLMYVWTRNGDVATEIAPVVMLIATGMVLNSHMVPAYALQLAHGWTSLGLYINIGLLVIFTPILWYLASTYGLIGAACYPLLTNAFYLIIGLTFTHRRYLKGELKDVILIDILPSLGISLLGFLTLWQIDPMLGANYKIRVAVAVAAGMLIVACNVLVCTKLRHAIMHYMRTFRS